jgi:hypothetical protein
MLIATTTASDKLSMAAEMLERVLVCLLTVELGSYPTSRACDSVLDTTSRVRVGVMHIILLQLLDEMEVVLVCCDVDINSLEFTLGSWYTIGVEL